jgi:transcriptional regulator with XRE-family HTH domain
MIGRRLREVRLSHGWSQARMGEFLELKQNVLSQYEKGKRRVPSELLERIVIDLGVNSDYLLRGKLPVFRNTLTDPRWFF